MKTIIILTALCASLFSCKKKTDEAPSTTSIWYVKVVAVDNDNITITETKPITLKVVEH